MLVKHKRGIEHAFNVRINDIEFPAIGETDFDIFSDNLLEVMQFALNRGDYGIDVILRLYVPDLDKFKTWSPPMAEEL